MARLNLTDLPVDLQARIMSHIDTSNMCRKLRIENSQEIYVDFEMSFPDELLALASLSPGLAEAARLHLSERATRLSRLQTNKITDWIPILGHELKSFSLFGGELIGYCHRGCVELACVCGDLYADVLKALDALGENDIALDVLDLEDLAFIAEARTQEIADAMAKAMRKSAFSVKKIAVSINTATIIAMESVTLPRLQFAQITADIHHIFDITQDVQHDESLGKILTTMNRYCNHSAPGSTLKELRLEDMMLEPLIDYQNCQRLFHGVEKLVVKNTLMARSKGIARFISNFKHLKSLDWDVGAITAQEMNTIFEQALGLTELNIHLDSTCVTQLQLFEANTRFRDLFVSFRGTTRILDFDTYLTDDQIKTIGQHSPNLEKIVTYVNSSNIEALGPLLGTDCRRLKELVFTCTREHTDNGLGEGGWKALADAVCSASELSTISYRWNKGTVTTDSKDEIVQSIIDIVDCLGNRAKKFTFVVPLNTIVKDYVMEVTWKILYACYVKCKSLESLRLDLPQNSHPGGVWLITERSPELKLKLIDMWKKLQTLPHIYSIDVEMPSTFYQDLEIPEINI